jgi:hypothetical protein
VLVDLAVLIADGGEAIADIDVLRHEEQLLGPVASDTTVWRALDEIGAVRRPGRVRLRVRALSQATGSSSYRPGRPSWTAPRALLRG